MAGFMRVQRTGIFIVWEINAMPTEPMSTIGELVEVYSEKAYRVRLRNGKDVIAHPSKDMMSRIAELVPPVRLALEMTPYDFDKARIVAIEGE